MNFLHKFRYLILLNDCQWRIVLKIPYIPDDAPFNNEIVIAIGGATTGRAHARTGDRYQDMKEMGIEPK